MKKNWPFFMEGHKDIFKREEKIIPSGRKGVTLLLKL